MIARARHQHTQAEAAKAAGVSASLWQRVEHGGPDPTRARVLGRLAVYLGCDPSDLIAGASSVAVGATQSDEPVVATSSSDGVTDGR